NQGDWARFFPIIALLQSTSDHSSKGGPPISFAGFAVEDAKILLELDFKAPPTSQCFAITWDTPKKKTCKTSSHQNERNAKSPRISIPNPRYSLSECSLSEFALSY
ncbi:hypothetical protein PSHT_05924, partial [Puccinia striiformis]